MQSHTHPHGTSQRRSADDTDEHEVREPLPELTRDQRAIADALSGDKSGATHLMDRPAGSGKLFWQVTTGVVGISSLVVGTVLVFFFAALGSLVLAFGAIMTALAFDGLGRLAED